MLRDASLFFQFRMVPTLYLFPHARLHVPLRTSLLPDTGAVHPGAPYFRYRKMHIAIVLSRMHVFVLSMCLGSRSSLVC